MNEYLVLVVEDDKPIRNLITTTLKMNDYRFITAVRGNEAIMLSASHKPDIIILDLGLPDIDGVEVIERIRTWSDVPIIIVSARSEDRDKITALDKGADDYLTKPFHLEELEARIRSLTRRRFTQNNVVLNCGKVAFDTKARVAVADGQELSLTRKEIGILEYLLLNQGRPVSQEELLDHVWDNSVDNFSNSIRVHISALRKKLRAALGYDPIRNRIGEGYVMEEEKV